MQKQASSPLNADIEVKNDSGVGAVLRDAGLMIHHADRSTVGSNTGTTKREKLFRQQTMSNLTQDQRVLLRCFAGWQKDIEPFLPILLLIESIGSQVDCLSIEDFLLNFCLQKLFAESPLP